MPDRDAERVFFRLMCVGGVARGVAGAQQASWLAGMATAGWTGSPWPALALWAATEAVGAAVVLGLQAWIWTRRRVPAAPGVDAALLAAALAGMFGSPIAQLVIAAGSSWALGLQGSASIGTLSTLWQGVRYLGGFAHLAGSLALLWRSYVEGKDGAVDEPA